MSAPGASDAMDIDIDDADLFGDSDDAEDEAPAAVDSEKAPDATSEGRQTGEDQPQEKESMEVEKDARGDSDTKETKEAVGEEGDKGDKDIEGEMDAATSDAKKESSQEKDDNPDTMELDEAPAQAEGDAEKNSDESPDSSDDKEKKPLVIPEGANRTLLCYAALISIVILNTVAYDFLREYSFSHFKHSFYDSMIPVILIIDEDNNGMQHLFFSHAITIPIALWGENQY